MCALKRELESGSDRRAKPWFPLTVSTLFVFHSPLPLPRACACVRASVRLRVRVCACVRVPVLRALRCAQDYLGLPKRGIKGDPQGDIDYMAFLLRFRPDNSMLKWKQDHLSARSVSWLATAASQQARTRCCALRLHVLRRGRRAKQETKTTCTK